MPFTGGTAEEIGKRHPCQRAALTGRQSLVYPSFLVSESVRAGMTILSAIHLGPYPQAEARELAAYGSFNSKPVTWG